MPISIRKSFFAFAATVLAMSFAMPAFAVWPMPPYSSYPDCTGTTPAENCSQQPGDKNLHWQVKMGERTVQYPGQFSCTPVSGQFGGFCDGPGCTSQGGFCRQPSILSAPSYEVVTKGSGTYVRFHVEYDFPGNYCQLSPDGNVAEWPVVFNGFHLNRLQVIDAASGNIIAESMAVFEHGQWNPLIPFCGTGNYILRVLNECQGLKQDAPVTIAAPPSGVSPTPCGGDRNCFFCSLSPSGGPGLPGPPGKPINAGSGDVTITLPLFSISQSPLSLSFGLEYHSQLAGNQSLINEPMGRGWTHPFNQSLRMIDVFDRDLYRLRADGSEVWYRWVPLQGNWTAERPGEVRETVTLVSGQYRIADLNGSVTAFDAATGAWLSTTDRWGNRISGSYAGGLLSALTDAEGRQVQFSYASGTLTQIALPDGSLWRFAYANGELAKIFDPIHTAATPWRTFEYQPDTRGVPRLLTAMKDEAGKLLEGHAYDALERGVTSVSENGHESVTVTFDAANHAIVTSSIDGATTQTATLSLIYQRGRYLPLQVVGNCASCGSGDDTETFQFDASNYPTQKTDGSGNVSNYVYDGNGDLIRRTDAVGTPRERTTTLTYGYPAWPWFVTQMTETSAAKPGAVKVITNAWNTTGPLETTLTSTVSGYLRSSDSAATTYTTTSTFDVHHRPLTMDGPRTDVSDVTTRTYYADTDANLNRRGRLQQTTDAVALTVRFDNYDVYGTALLATDPNNVQTVLLTDARGRVITRTAKAVTGDPRETADYVATSVFDGRDRLVRTTMPRGNAMSYAYEDGTNRLTDTIRLDAAGNEAERRHLTFNSIGDKIREEDQQCASPAPTCASWVTKRQEDFAYDIHNRLAAVLHAVPSGSAVLYAYDGSGRIQSVQDENHTAPNTTYAYDELNRLSAVTQTLGSGSIVTRYAYDVQDNLVSVTDPNGNTTTYAYDDFRRMQTQTSPVTGLTSYTYDNAGNLTATTDANNATTRRTYDAANRVTSSVSTGSSGPAETLAWTYDDATAGNYGKGRVARTTDTTGSMTYAYDRRGLMRTEQHTIEGNAYSILYGYDANGNRSSITYPSGRVVTYTFDFADRALSAASAGTNFVTSATYLPFGPEGQVTFGNGTTKSMTYDARYRPLENKLTSGLGVLADYQYSEDAVGNITAIRDAVDPSYNRDFGYDDLHRLTRANSGSSLWGAGSYAYDAMGNMLSLSLGPQRQSAFAYSGTLPKLTSVIENGSARAVSYDAAGNEQAVGGDSSSYSPRNLLTAASGLAYGYDSRGLRTITTVTSALGTVSGTVVTAASGAAIAGATVTIDGSINSTVTDANGNFSLNQPGGNFTLTVVKNGFLPETTTAFTLAAGATLPVGTIKLSVAPSTITGIVVSSLGGNVAGATVALSGSGVTASTNAGGNFSITIAAGTFTASISAGGYTSQTTPSFTTQPGQTYALGTLTLAAIPATVSGTVTSSTGGAVAGATVTATGGPTGASHNGRIKTLAVTTTTTDGSGNFTLSLAAGTYSLTIAKTGFGTANTSQFAVGAGTTFSIGTVIIDPLGTISGVVVAQSTGSPIANATVSLPGNLSSVSTDATGHFAVQQTSGTYSIHVSATGYADVNTPFFTLAPGASYDAGTIQLPAVALAVYVGYADDLRPSANFPVPWAGTPNVLYIGSSSPIDAGAIRLDNNTDAALPVDSVTVDLGRPGPAFNLWGSFTVPAHGSLILTQTSQFNFDTSDYPIGQCGQNLVAGDPRVPIVAVKSNGVTTTYFDTAHILDTGGFDLACSGNESLQWRLIGTTGINANGDFLLSPPTGTNQLGQPYTVTASVTDANGQPLANVNVTFKVIQGPNVGANGSAVTNAAGTAVFAYTGHSAGTDTIQASITNASGGVSKSNPVTVNWPAFSNLNVFVGYADDLRAGASFPNPWQGSPNVVYIGSGLPIDAGAIRIDNASSTAVVIDKVLVDLQRPGPTFDLWGSFTIPPHGSAILTQTTQYNFDTSDYQITGCFGVLSPTDPRIPKITITTAGQSASYLDTSHILDTFGYDLAVCPDPSNESLQWRPVGSTSTASAGHLALRPLSTLNAVGATYTTTAVATDAGNEPVAGLPVDFRVVTGPNSGTTGHATTDANGLATFTYSSATAGTDTLRASITNTLGAVLNSNDVTSTWVSNVSLQLAPASATAAIGSPDNATAFVTDGSGSPLANLIVAFRVTTGPNAGKTGLGTTDATGHAVFTYFSAVGGTDTLVASVAGANGSSILSNQVTVIWSAPMSITLAPSSASNAIGANYTATAFVSTAGSPSSGASVTFTVITGPNSGRTSTATTDGTGHATFTFASSTLGIDVVQATTGSVNSNQVIARWIAIPTALTYTGALAGEVNDPLTLSARLTEASSGNAVAGRTVTFTLGSQTLTATTDASGNATVNAAARTSTGAIAASVTFAAAGSYTGSSASVFINIVRDESLIRYTGKSVVADGTAQTLTALLTDSDGVEPLTGRTVTFTIGSVVASATSDATGIATANVTIPISAGTGSIRLVASFAGDASNVPALTSVPVILYQPQSFVIWGGNAIPPHIGDHVNFWGSQWDRQVTGGDYGSNASFKGWATPVASALVPCGLTGHANGTCWTSKPGNSSPPALIERYVSVIVSTSIVKNGNSIDGNIAAVVVVRVDASPAYANDPGKPGYGTIVAVITDGARLFGTSTPVPSYAGYFFRHLATPRTQIASLSHSDLATFFSLTTPAARVTSVLRPTPLTVAAGTKRYSFYTPEMHLLAETALTSSGAPTTAYEYIWFNGHPVAQIDASAATHWTFTDHLGTPILLTNTDATTYWRAEYEPFGAIYALRSPDVHQPLRLPGQEAEQLNLGANGVTEREYNVFRWYRAGWGTYTQVDPIDMPGQEYAYGGENPARYSDRLGLFNTGQAAKQVARQAFNGCEKEAGSSLGGPIAMAIVALFQADDANPQEFENQIKPCKKCCNELNDVVQQAKKKVGGLGGCENGMSRWALLQRYYAWLELATARARRDVKCWDGGDEGHQREQAAAWSNLGKCARLLGWGP
ncbi:MAG TPA: carboxypeptidase regulatory-like domain-containing protein [Thermoanaerobaculia bacterium]|jgi:RHS repeat-associated protein|nr:carboxypeptidase regulatory-like domain-containing protein [Thermoanaerobaculia bacterium]